MIGLTRDMRDCLLVIQELLDASGIAPSLDEIAHELCISGKTGAHRLVTSLEERGYIRRLVGRRRSIEVLQRLPMPEDVEFVPFLTPATAAPAAAEST